MFKNKLSKNLLTMRNNLNFNKKEMSEYLSIEYSTYCNYEYGNREPNLDEVISISMKLRQPISKLINENIEDEINYTIPMKFNDDDLKVGSWIENDWKWDNGYQPHENILVIGATNEFSELFADRLSQSLTCYSIPDFKVYQNKSKNKFMVANDDKSVCKAVVEYRSIKTLDKCSSELYSHIYTTEDLLNECSLKELEQLKEFSKKIKR